MIEYIYFTSGRYKVYFVFLLTLSRNVKIVHDVFPEYLITVFECIATLTMCETSSTLEKETSSVGEGPRQ
jgi:hypothetical protein